jgi:hypothetical protein
MYIKKIEGIETRIMLKNLILLKIKIKNKTIKVINRLLLLSLKKQVTKPTNIVKNPKNDS